jgi:hypothetical protein
MTIHQLILRTSVLLAVIMTVLLPTVAYAQQREALRDGAVVRGKLSVVKTKHPNGTPIQAFQLLSAGDYFLNDDEFCEKGVALKKFHIVARDRDTTKRLERSLGKVVSIKGAQFYCAHTAWHIGDAVVADAEIVDDRP